MFLQIFKESGKKGCVTCIRLVHIFLQTSVTQANSLYEYNKTWTRCNTLISLQQTSTPV